MTIIKHQFLARINIPAGHEVEAASTFHYVYILHVLHVYILDMNKWQHHTIPTDRVLNFDSISNKTSIGFSNIFTICK